LPLGFFDRDLDHAQMLFARVSVGLSPVVPQGTRKSMPCFDLAAHQLAQRRFIQRPSPERSDQRRAASRKHVPPPDVT
jgi:hypothetical protein